LESTRWLPWASFAAIVLFSLFAVFQAPRLDTDFQLDTVLGAVLLGVLLVVAVMNILTVRFLVLPRAAANPAASRETVMATGYAFAVAPSVYGLVLSLFTGQGLLALPFTAVSLGSLLAIRLYLQDAPPKRPPGT
jgi:hypothetical protein